MQPEFWYDRWERNEIGFHQDSVNQYLRDHWSILGLQGHEALFVPLCGKSLDMLWIHQLGHRVLGVEISPLACAQFFEEARLTPQIEPLGAFTRYAAERIEILCGDVFDLTESHLADVTAVYDRAALIALPETLRGQYVEHLQRILPGAAQVLLVTMQYPQEEMDGPPFSVEEAEVRRLFETRFQVQCLHRNELGRDDPFAKRKGLSDLWESVFHLTPSSLEGRN